MTCRESMNDEIGVYAAERRHDNKPVSTPLNSGDIFIAGSGSGHARLIPSSGFEASQSIEPLGETKNSEGQ